MLRSRSVFVGFLLRSPAPAPSVKAAFSLFVEFLQFGNKVLRRVLRLVKFKVCFKFFTFLGGAAFKFWFRFHKKSPAAPELSPSFFLSVNSYDRGYWGLFLDL